MYYNFYFMLYTNSNKILVKFSISILMVCCGFSQVRINDTKSITSSLEILDLVQNESSLILGTSGGLSTYDIGAKKFSTFTNDQGLEDVEIKKLFIDLNNLLWIGFQNKIQVWDLENERSIALFNLGIQNVSGFVDFNGIIYSAVKKNDVWGLMEFLQVDEKIYYRDFYEISESNIISDIDVFGSRIFLNLGNTMIAGNPTVSHPMFWQDPFPDINENIKSLYVNDTTMIIQTNQKLILTSFSNNFTIIKENENIVSEIKDLHIDNLHKSIYGITDSTIFTIIDTNYEKIFKDSFFGFNVFIKIDNEIWIGSNVGLAKFASNNFEHISNNQPIVSSPSKIDFSENGDLVIASKDGVSVSGWKNLKKVLNPQNISSNLNLYNIDINLENDISSVLIIEDKVYIGLIQSDQAGIISFNLQFPETSFNTYKTTLISSVYKTKDMFKDRNNNLWILNDGATQGSIQILNDNRILTINDTGGYNIKGSNAIAIDNYNRLWIATLNSLIIYSYANTAFDPQNEKWVEIPIYLQFLREPFDINVSPKNRLWILTNYGLIYKDLKVNNDDPVISTGPIKANGDLSPFLTNVPFNKKSKIEFDPRGNIWITTDGNGVFVINEFGEFWPSSEGINISNSNLLSDNVNGVSFDDSDGLAYIATNKGITVLKIPFAKPKASYSAIDIFPSPFKIPSNKRMTIDGLRDNSKIIIMTLNGKVINQISAENISGYQAYWDGRDIQNRLVKTGIYLVKIFDKKGKFTFEKIAVINQ